MDTGNCAFLFSVSCTVEFNSFFARFNLFFPAIFFILPATQKLCMNIKAPGQMQTQTGNNFPIYTSTKQKQQLNRTKEMFWNTAVATGFKKSP